MVPIGGKRNGEHFPSWRRKGQKQEAEDHVTIEVSRLDSPESAALVRLAGFLQRRAAASLLDAFKDLSENDVSKIVVDMADVQYTNSSAIGAFVNMASAVKASGGKMVLFAMPANIRKIFNTLGLTGLFETAPTREEAIEMIS